MTAIHLNVDLFNVSKNGHGAWCVFYGDRMISDHATRDGAVAAYRNLVRAAEAKP